MMEAPINPNKRNFKYLNKSSQLLSKVENANLGQMLIEISKSLPKAEIKKTDNINVVPVPGQKSENVDVIGPNISKLNESLGDYNLAKKTDITPKITTQELTGDLLKKSEKTKIKQDLGDWASNIDINDKGFINLGIFKNYCRTILDILGSVNAQYRHVLRFINESSANLNSPDSVSVYDLSKVSEISEKVKIYFQAYRIINGVNQFNYYQETTLFKLKIDNSESQDTKINVNSLANGTYWFEIDFNTLIGRKSTNVEIQIDDSDYDYQSQTVSLSISIPQYSYRISRDNKDTDKIYLPGEYEYSTIFENQIDSGSRTETITVKLLEYFNEVDNQFYQGNASRFQCFVDSVSWVDGNLFTPSSDAGGVIFKYTIQPNDDRTASRSFKAGCQYGTDESRITIKFVQAARDNRDILEITNLERINQKIIEKQESQFNNKVHREYTLFHKKFDGSLASGQLYYGDLTIRFSTSEKSSLYVKYWGTGQPESQTFPSKSEDTFVPLKLSTNLMGSEDLIVTLSTTQLNDNYDVNDLKNYKEDNIIILKLIQPYYIGYKRYSKGHQFQQSYYNLSYFIKDPRFDGYTDDYKQEILQLFYLNSSVEAMSLGDNSKYNQKRLFVRNFGIWSTILKPDNAGSQWNYKYYSNDSMPFSDNISPQEKKDYFDANATYGKTQWGQESNVKLGIRFSLVTNYKKKDLIDNLYLNFRSDDDCDFYISPRIDETDDWGDENNWIKLFTRDYQNTSKTFIGNTSAGKDNGQNRLSYVSLGKYSSKESLEKYLNCDGSDNLFLYTVHNEGGHQLAQFNLSLFHPLVGDYTKDFYKYYTDGTYTVIKEDTQDKFKKNTY